MSPTVEQIQAAAFSPDGAKPTSPVPSMFDYRKTKSNNRWNGVKMRSKTWPGCKTPGFLKKPGVLPALSACSGEKKKRGNHAALGINK
jgi:hypothetical protein